MDDKTTTVKLADVDPDKAKRFAQRLHRKKDDIEITRKSAVAEVSDSSDDDRTITARVSTPDRDRDGEVVEPKGIDLGNYNTNPVLMWSHDYKLPPIGRAMWTKIDDNGLLCKFEFAKTAFADEIYMLYRDGFLKTFSIGFIPMEFDGKTKTHKRTSLLEVSACAIPSNPMALMEASAKGLVLCDSLKHDLGLDAVEGDAIEPDATPKATLVAALEGDLTAQIETAVKEITNGESASFEEVNADTNPDEVTGSDPETKDAPVSAVGEAPSPTETAPAPDALAAAISALTAKVDALTARLVPLAPVVEPVPAPAPADFIAIDPEPDILAGLSLTPAPVPTQAQAPKSIDTMTEDEVIGAVGKAIAALDIGKQIKELVDLSLDKLRGRVR